MERFFCEEIQRWISENITRPMDTWVTDALNSCASAPTPINWICSLIVVLIRIVVLIVELVMRLVAVVLCVIVRIIDFVLDLIGGILNLLMSIPFIGGIIRAVVNWFTEWAWRLANLPDFVLTLAGVMVPKKMFLKLIILNRSGVPLTGEASVLPLIQRAREILLRECNVELIYKGVCVPQINSPEEALLVNCGEIGLSDFGNGGAYYELVSADCGFQDGIRRATGLGAEVIAFVIDDVSGSLIGCSGWVLHNYVVLQDDTLATDMNLLAHEIGHACILFHHDDINNLMFRNAGRTGTVLTSEQRAWLRSSRHCVFF